MTQDITVQLAKEKRGEEWSLTYMREIHYKLGEKGALTQTLAEYCWEKMNMSKVLVLQS